MDSTSAGADGWCGVSTSKNATVAREMDVSIKAEVRTDYRSASGRTRVSYASRLLEMAARWEVYQVQSQYDNALEVMNWLKEMDNALELEEGTTSLSNHSIR
jgi:hypothetical protein